MKLSEDLQQCHDCGDFGKDLEGYPERAESLERALWLQLYMNACDKGAGHNEANRFADEQLANVDKP